MSEIERLVPPPAAEKKASDTGKAQRGEERFSEAEERALRQRIAELEGALHRTRAELGALARCWPGTVTMLDLDWNIISISSRDGPPPGVQDAAELIGINAFELMPPESQQAARQMIEQILAEGVAETREFAALNPDGRRTTIEITVTLIEDERGQPAGVMAATQDISARREAESAREEAETALRQSERRFRTLVTSALDAIVLFDADARLQFVNEAGARLLAADSPEEMVGIHAMELIPTELHTIAIQEREELMDSGELQRELVLQRRDGTKVQVEFTASVIEGPDSEPQGIMVILRDITERKRGEAALRETEELRELDRLKDDFLSTVSHELRTPLVSLQGYVELLLKHEVGWDKARQWLGVALRSSRRLEGIINGLLDISRLRLGTIQLDSEPIDFGELVSAAVQTFRPQLSNRSLVLESVVAPELPPVSGDRQRLQSVLLNLLDNAVKFSRDGGTITVRVERQDPAWVLVTVKDTGIGIPEAHLERVFTRFFQVQSSLTREYGGSGIGLSLVKELVEAHGGRVWVESTDGGGSTFRVLLPEAPVERGELTEQWAHGQDETGLRSRVEVLVIDEDPDVRQLVATMLEQEGCAVRMAANGAQGLELLRDHGAELLLVDLSTPDAGGIDVCAVVKADPRYSDLPVYVMFTGPGESGRRVAREAGVEGFLEKPFSVEALSELLEAIRQRDGIR